MSRLKKFLPIIFKINYSFLLFLFLFLLPEKIEAQTIKYNCALKKQWFFWKTEKFTEDLRLNNWDLEVNLNQNIVYVNTNNPLSKKYKLPPLIEKYLIVKADKNYVVASKTFTPASLDKPAEVPVATESLILDLNTKNLTHASQYRNYLAPYSFSVHFGQCYINRY